MNPARIQRLEQQLSDLDEARRDAEEKFAELVEQRIFCEVDLLHALASGDPVRLVKAQGAAKAFARAEVAGAATFASLAQRRGELRLDLARATQSALRGAGGTPQ